MILDDVTLTDADVDFALERFDQTDKQLQRRIVAQTMFEKVKFEHALSTLRSAVVNGKRDCHVFGTRHECKTCTAITTALGEPYGCNDWWDRHSI